MIRFHERDPYSPIQYVYPIDSILYRHKSAYQDILVVSSPYFGRMLILDGVVQLTEKDEYMYHEMMAHIALHAHPDPKHVIVVGGGDGGVVREVAKHQSVEKIDLVEIDKEVVEVSRRFFPTVSTALDDPRVSIHAVDGAKFLSETEVKADVIIVDSTDIIGHARSLYTQQFFKSAKNALTGNGLFVTHAESIHFHLPMARQVYRELKNIFNSVKLYSAPIATYAGNWWAFLIASKGNIDPSKPQKEWKVKTKYYCPEIHIHSFVPQILQNKILESEEWPDKPINENE